MRLRASYAAVERRGGALEGTSAPPEDAGAPLEPPEPTTGVQAQAVRVQRDQEAARADPTGIGVSAFAPEAFAKTLL